MQHKRVARLSLWRAKMSTWEYWPWWLANVPVYGFWLWFALRARHLFFFSNVNPAIPLGGAVGESKHDILRRLPAPYVPRTLLLEPGIGVEELGGRLVAAGLTFPLMAKPDVGERGFLVKKAESLSALHEHLSRYAVPFLVQEFLTLPMEMTVLFHRFPGEGGRFGVTSVCVKAFLQVVGDGRAQVRALMARSERAAFQVERFERDFPDLMGRVPAAGQVLLLEPVGNHARGTKFLNGNALISPALLAAFEPLCRRLEGVHYGRFDLKCASEEAMLRGEYQVMELNGVLGEPAHIYDPRYGMWRAYGDLYRHWRLLYRLHRAQRLAGARPMPYGEAWRIIREYFRYKRRVGG
ncbi:MAG TPA: D-alanine--D-alanine ligase [Saprospiraceae bacterium]|nr:D-alanine--D-alanine ligase [Saprospiraceae bacterium]HND88012.1 D-alanine--D-alanine ligase [Saprospiraceae bacterium]